LTSTSTIWPKRCGGYSSINSKSTPGFSGLIQGAYLKGERSTIAPCPWGTLWNMDGIKLAQKMANGNTVKLLGSPLGYRPTWRVTIARKVVTIAIKKSMGTGEWKYNSCKTG